jgi:hypothetical protein
MANNYSKSLHKHTMIEDFVSRLPGAVPDEQAEFEIRAVILWKTGGFMLFQEKKT